MHVMLLAVWMYVDSTPGGTVGSWLVRSSPDRAVRVLALAWYIALCLWARRFTLIMRSSTQGYKYVPANLMLGIALWWNSIPSRGEVEKLLVASCYRNQAPAWRATRLVRRLCFVVSRKFANTVREADGQKMADISSSRNDRNSSLLKTTKASVLLIFVREALGNYLNVKPGYY